MSNQKGAVHLLLPLVVLVTISLVAFSRVQTTTKFEDSNVQGVIAKNDNNNPGRGSAENRGNSVSEVRSSSKTQTSSETSKNDNKETGNKENKTGTSVSPTGAKSKIQPKTVITKEAERENEVEDEATESAGQDESEGLQELRSISKFPLRIDTSTNQLIMTKNGTERVLTTLPAKAVANMLRAHLKKGLGPKFFQATPSATPVSTSSATPSASPEEEPISSDSADITVLEDQMSLEEENKQIVYKIPAKKRLKLFGFIPVTTDLTGIVSAQTGVLIEEKESLLSKILSFLSS